MPLALLSLPSLDYLSCFFVDFDLVRLYINQIHHLFYASTPKYIPVLFPRALSRLPDDYSLDTLALNGKYWSAANVQKFAEEPILDWPKITVDSNSYKWTTNFYRCVSNERKQSLRPDDLEDHPLPNWRRFKWVEKVKTLEGLSKSLDSSEHVSSMHTL